ncbi:MAG: hypothetical protein GEU90_09335 [Gemmatimonas sp.]|nr:hypothetical protein [Gemmatimonas sp.]
MKVTAELGTDKGKKTFGKTEASPERLLLAATGMEAEFSLMIDGRPSRPEAIFRDPRSFLGDELMHRTGASYHLGTGGAVYFDTGVIEVATPAMEIERGCAARAGRSLWEGILEVRRALDQWGERTRQDAALVGFSAHYNVSFELPSPSEGPDRTIEKLAHLLVYILPAPVMLLATNRRSSGVGVRPRGDRIEITVDFTPSPALMIATGTFIVGVAREVMKWPSFDLSELDRMQIPVFEDFNPIPHTSRSGWLAHESSFPSSPFTSDVNAQSLALRDGKTASLRQVARRIMRRFWHPIRRISDPFTFRLIRSVISGQAPSLLDLPDRPVEYEHVGRLCSWDNLFPERELSRSRYERVLIRAIQKLPLTLDGQWYVPVGMKGWSAVVFKPENGDGNGRKTVPIDALTGRLDEWCEPAGHQRA